MLIGPPNPFNKQDYQLMFMTSITEKNRDREERKRVEKERDREVRKKIEKERDREVRNKIEKERDSWRFRERQSM